jgi:hypothetical protein
MGLPGYPIVVFSGVVLQRSTPRSGPRPPPLERCPGQFTMGAVSPEVSNGGVFVWWRVETVDARRGCTGMRLEFACRVPQRLRAGRTIGDGRGSGGVAVACARVRSARAQFRDQVLDATPHCPVVSR